jgi:hypothetical protein
MERERERGMEREVWNRESLNQGVRTRTGGKERRPPSSCYFFLGWVVVVDGVMKMRDGDEEGIKHDSRRCRRGSRSRSRSMV